MMIHEITELAGKYRARKRIGRGHGSGTGKQAGRGHKGAKSRSGYSRRISFEGGQMPYFRRMPKFGFSNSAFRTVFWTVNLRDLLQSEAFKAGGKVDPASLMAAGLVRDDSRDIKVLGALPEGTESLSVKFEVEVHRVTDSVRRLVTDAGGTVTELGTRKDRVRGVDRNSDDRAPRNQTKKSKRRQWQQKKAEAATRGEVLKKK